MTIVPSTPGSAAFCSRLSAERGLPPIGTAGSYDAVIAFELDSPWTARIAGSAASDARLDEAIEGIGSRAKRVRLLALEPAEGLRRSRGRDRARVLYFSRSDGPFSAYARREYDVVRTDLPETLEALAGIGAGAVRGEEGEAGAEVRDVLVCTHGSRDACCGKFGYNFFVEMRGLAAVRHRNVRVWRSSHLGGHRFAPTLLDLPSGRMFGRLEAGDAEAVLAGGAALLARLPFVYRGRCALPEPAQIVERELWLRRGADFEHLAVDVRGTREGETWNVAVEAEGGDPLSACVARDEVEAVVTPASCGRDPETEAPWRILR